MARLIDFIRFDHISMAVPDRDQQVELLQRLFGFRWTRDFEDDEGYYGAALAVPGRSSLAWEVLQPRGDESYLHRFLNGPHGAGLHHVAMWARSARQAAESMQRHGIAPWGFREPEPGEDGGSAVYIHPKAGHGFLFQFMQGEPREYEPFDDEEPHTLGIVAVNHIAHATPDRDALAEWYEEVLGLETIYASDGDGMEHGFRTRVLETPTRQLRFEMIEPAGEGSFIARFLERRGGPAMHHVTFEVDDWTRAVEACIYHEIPIFGERSGETDGVPWREAFIHPRHTGGMLVQFFWQAAPGAWI